MNKLIIFLLLLNNILISQDKLILKDKYGGLTYLGEVVDINDSTVVFKEDKMISANYIELYKVQFILNKDGKTLYPKKSLSKQIVYKNRNLSSIGGAFIALGALISLINNNKDDVVCENISSEVCVSKAKRATELTKDFTNYSYLLILLGGLLIMLDEPGNVNTN